MSTYAKIDEGGGGAQTNIEIIFLIYRWNIYTIQTTRRLQCLFSIQLSRDQQKSRDQCPVSP